MMRFGPFVLCVTGVLASVCLPAQEKVSIIPRSRPAPLMEASVTPNLRYDVRMVQVPVVVTDPHGRPLVQLARQSFRLFEDDVERPITAFTIDDAPISATLVFDSSRSMKPRMSDARAGVEQFLKTALPGDEFSLVRFSDQAEILSGFTPEPADILRQLSGVQAHGWTALFDALFLGAQQVRKGHNQRKVLVIFSDGGDNNSRYSEAELISRLREEDVEVYAISLFEKPRCLDRLADETGGRAFWVKKLEDLPDAIDTLSRQIRSEYLIGYTPGATQNDGKYHRIRIEVQPPAGVERIRASWRRGYTSPGE